ncbi:MAG: nucleotidyltransferase family protein [Acidobacteriia bacterium]|nr:nucleotidyltransferase family protein [Terriglobia bacterium]
MTREGTVTRDTDLLLLCAHGRPDSAAIRKRVQKGIDWSRFLSLAETHHLSSLCYRRLEDACPDLIPPDTLHALREKFRRNVARNLFFAGELHRILAHLDSAGVTALAFKGPVLAWWLYDHPGVREYADLDLLVDQRDLNRAIDVFGSLGFSTHAGMNDQVLPSTHEISLYRTSPPAVVDLHWDLAPPEMGLLLDARNMLPSATTVLVAGRPTRTFGAVDQLLYCAFHGGKHGWRNLAWLADLSALMETRQPDWPRVLAEARRKHLSRALFAGLRLAHDLLGTPVPADIQRLLDRDHASAAIAKRARLLLLNGPAARSLFPSALGNQLSVTEGGFRKIQYLWRKVTEPTTEDWNLARGTRPFRLARKYARRLAAAWSSV